MLQSPPGSEIIVDGRPYLNFVGTDYLGLAARPEAAEAATDAIRRFGLTSSNVRTQHGLHEPLARAEARLADFFGTERAVFLQSGTSAATAVGYWLALQQAEPVILVDRAIHPSSQDLIRAAETPLVEPFEHFDLEDLEEQLRRVVSQNHRRIVVLTDSVAGGTGRAAPLNFYYELLKEISHDPVQTMLIVDESHALGLLGQTGRGLLEAYDLPSFSADHGPRIVSFASTAKALGIPGAVIPCDAETAERLIAETPIGRAATPPSPATAAAIVRNIEIVRNEPPLRRSLADNRGRLVARLDRANIPHVKVANEQIPIVALPLDSADLICQIRDRLKQRGILVTHSHYTGTSEEGVLRIALRADHTADQIDRLATALEDRV